MQGVEVYIVDGFAEVQFIDRATRGQLIGKLLEAATDAGVRVRVDTGGLRRRYVVPEHVAAAAGLIDDDDTSDEHLGVPLVAQREWDNADDASYDESSAEPELDDVEADDETPAAPPRPGTKGGTKAAWLAYARATGVDVTDDMSAHDIYAAVKESTT